MYYECVLFYVRLPLNENISDEDENSGQKFSILKIRIDKIT
jgi:hypothetical protein